MVVDIFLHVSCFVTFGVCIFFSSEITIRIINRLLCLPDNLSSVSIHMFGDYGFFLKKEKLSPPRVLKTMQEATTIYINQFFFLKGFTPELARFKGFSLTFCVSLMYLFCTGPIIRSGQYSICFIVWGKKPLLNVWMQTP